MLLVASTTLDLTQVLIAFITGLPALLGALGVFLMQLRTNAIVKLEGEKNAAIAKEVKNTLSNATATKTVRTIETEKKIEAIASQVNTIEIATNSMKDALIEATEKAALLQGHAAGVAEQKKEQSEAAK